jgi:hypothetical protein
MEADEAEPCCQSGVGSIGSYLQRLTDTETELQSLMTKAWVLLNIIIIIIISKNARRSKNGDCGV